MELCIKNRLARKERKRHLNIDANVQKVLSAILKKWKLILLFAVIGAILAAIFTSRFTTLTYTSSIEFLAYAVDSNQELSDSTAAAQQASETSKMNYAMKMMDTYIEVFQTNQFNQAVVDELNRVYGTDYSASTVKNSITIEKVENTAMFLFTITTSDADLSYHIAQCLETCVPEAMQNTNSGLVQASVEDPPLRASAAESMGYPKKCLIGAVAGIFVAGLYAVLRDFLDVRIKGRDDLNERYNIPVLGSIPEFEQTERKTKKKGVKSNG